MYFAVSPSVNEMCNCSTALSALQIYELDYIQKCSSLKYCSTGFLKACNRLSQACDASELSWVSVTQSSVSL